MGVIDERNFQDPRGFLNSEIIGCGMTSRNQQYIYDCRQ